jgi:hypothetical protein
VEWDNPDTGDGILMSTSTDGGLTWGPATATATHAAGIGGQPLVQPAGTVVVPIETSGISAFTSTNGGATWSAPVTVSNIQSHTDAGGIRSGPLPSAAVDGAGTVYVVWEDCRFRASCSTNDLVYSTSSDGIHWSKVARIPIDPSPAQSIISSPESVLIQPPPAPPLTLPFTTTIIQRAVAPRQRAGFMSDTFPRTTAVPHGTLQPSWLDR